MQDMQETRVQSLGWEDPMEEGMATHSSVLAWRIPWTEEPGRLPSLGSQKVRHNWSNLAHMQLSALMQETPKHALGPRPKGGTGREKRERERNRERRSRVTVLELRRGPDGNLQRALETEQGPAHPHQEVFKQGECTPAVHFPLRNVSSHLTHTMWRLQTSRTLVPGRKVSPDILSSLSHFRG